jgi:hypothetical protein
VKEAKKTKKKKREKSEQKLEEQRKNEKPDCFALQQGRDIELFT